jgi:tetratricopeptide (TPR) repeat protein
LAAGLAGALLLLSLPALHDLWLINLAGALLNKYGYTQDLATLSRAERTLETYLSGRLSGTDPSLHASFYRTFGAVASARRPTSYEYSVLAQGWKNQRLDRTGVLWLGEVAAGTGNWPVAREAYSYVDASNLLAYRGDTAAAEGRLRQAADWYRLAQTSLLGRRAGAGARLSLTPEGPGERAVGLLRIGRGFLAVGRPEEASESLRIAYEYMQHDSPPARERQSILFTLAEAEIACVRSDEPLPPSVISEVDRLLHEALSIERSAWSHLRAAHLLLLCGRKGEAIDGYRAALSFDPLQADAHLSLGGIYERDGLHSLARDLYRDGVARLPSNRALADALAKSSYLTMDVSKSLALLRRAVESGSRDPFVFAYLGDALLRIDGVDAARAAYRSGLDLAPGAKPLLERLTSLPRPTGALP